MQKSPVIFVAQGAGRVISQRQRVHWMQEDIAARIKSAVIKWAQSVYASDEIVIGMAAADDIDDEDGTRYLVDYAVRQEGQWLVAEVWVQNGVIVGINDLGEGLPLDDSEWPWPVAENN
jgi:hypothetical protein